MAESSSWKPRRRKSALERRQQQERAEGRRAQHLLKALASIHEHRGSSLCVIGTAMKEALERHMSPTSSTRIHSMVGQADAFAYSHTLESERVSATHGQGSVQVDPPLELISPSSHDENEKVSLGLDMFDWDLLDSAGEPHCEQVSEYDISLAPESGIGFDGLVSEAQNHSSDKFEDGPDDSLSDISQEYTVRLSALESAFAPLVQQKEEAENDVLRLTDDHANIVKRALTFDNLRNSQPELDLSSKIDDFYDEAIRLVRDKDVLAGFVVELNTKMAILQEQMHHMRSSFNMRCTG